MDPISIIISYLLGLAANLRTDAILAAREEKLNKQFEQEDTLRKALAFNRPLREEVRVACVELVRNRHRLGVKSHEEPLWILLCNDDFQDDLVEWLMAGGIEEGIAAKQRLLMRMEPALAKASASPEQIVFLRNSYFDALEKVIFSHPILARWRHQLSLDFLRQQVTVLRRRAEEAAGVYSVEKQQAALDCYCDKALAEWDIIDLSNLPEGDIQMATQKLLLRQLYMPLRIEVEPKKPGEGDDAALARFEEQREARRHREAGHLFAQIPSESDGAQWRSPVGKRLGIARRLVVLGDPGGGKTTMLRWLATAYLMRHRGDNSVTTIPDTETLPSLPWIPVLIRCRNLGEADLCRCFTDFLTQHLYKTELLPEDAEVMRAVILDRIAKGEVLLLVDGLDEITNPLVRMTFCQELERTAARYPDTAVVVTSRIVGYRDMPYRMGSGFEHGVIAELSREDKDVFARRWVEVTEQHQPAADKEKRAQELLEALHSSDRIERLTGNPLLLTTLALVKRKVGKLPNRRTKLYAEAVSVLLNWNPRIYKTIEEDEAIPQLGYLAYEMCRRGVQRLTNDEVLDLLEKIRTEYPNVRAISRREPQAFLALLEERSSILIKSGGIWQTNKSLEHSVWEFRHLTFQEYLAARALIEGRYPSRDKTKSLAEQVAPLAGAVEKTKRRRDFRANESEVEVPESWREVLRLLVADCKDDDVEEVLRAILNPMAGEEPARTTRARAVLAVLCLADEPNVSADVGEQVLSAFASAVGKADGDGPRTVLDSAAIEIGDSMWSPLLKRVLIQAFCKRSDHTRWNVGGLWGLSETTARTKSGNVPALFVTELQLRLKSGDRVEAISAALTVMVAAFDGVLKAPEELAGSLLDLLLGTDHPARFAATWALGWLSNGPANAKPRRPLWVAKGEDLNRVGQALRDTPLKEHSTRRWLATILGHSNDTHALPYLMPRLDDRNVQVRRTVVTALGRLGDKKAVAPLLAALDDRNVGVRTAAVEALGLLGDRQAIPSLLALLDTPDADLLEVVIGVLGKMGDKQVVPSLLALLDVSSSSIRQSISRALVELGDKHAVPSLLALLNTPNVELRADVIGVLGQLGDKQAVLPLLALLDDASPSVFVAAVEALGRLGDKQAVPSLIARLTHNDVLLRKVSISALGQLADKRAVPALVPLLEDRENELYTAAAVAIARLGVESGVSALAELLDHSSVERRVAAVSELAMARGDRTEQMLLSRDLDGIEPWIDPAVPITEARIARAARGLGKTGQEVRSRYESIAADFRLKFA